jgi:YD repeat-containing protein
MNIQVSYISHVERGMAMEGKMQKRQRVLTQRTRLFAIMVALIGWTLDAAVAVNGSVLYTYDALGRIITATYDTGVIAIYTYDSNGNRLSQTINVNTATLTWTATANPCTANCWGQGLW